MRVKVYQNVSVPGRVAALVLVFCLVGLAANSTLRESFTSSTTYSVIPHGIDRSPEGWLTLRVEYVPSRSDLPNQVIFEAEYGGPIQLPELNQPIELRCQWTEQFKAMLCRSGKNLLQPNQ